MLLEEGVCYDQYALLAKLLAFSLLHFVFQGQTCLLLQVSLELSTFAFQYPIILLFPTVNGVLKARILKWFANCFQGKPFNITVIQVYAPTSNAEEAEVEWFYEDLQDFLGLTFQKSVFFTIGEICPWSTE